MSKWAAYYFRVVDAFGPSHVVDVMQQALAKWPQERNAIVTEAKDVLAVHQLTIRLQLIKVRKERTEDAK